MRTETITSVQNPKIREALSLGYKSKIRREKGLFLVEGVRELGHCLEAGFRPRTIFRCPETIGDDVFSPIAQAAESANPDCRCFDLSPEVYAKIAYREGTEGVLAEVEWKERTLGDIHPAAGADAVIVCDPLTDLYNPNVVRSSIGAVFTVPTVACTSAEAISWLKSKGIRILTAQLQDSSPYYDTPMTGPTAIVMGTESTGLTPVWREAADSHILIPMLGRLDSLNVSVSAAILLFEAVRQRQGQARERRP